LYSVTPATPELPQLLGPWVRLTPPVDPSLICVMLQDWGNG